MVSARAQTQASTRIRAHERGRARVCARNAEQLSPLTFVRLGGVSYVLTRWCGASAHTRAPHRTGGTSVAPPGVRVCVTSPCVYIRSARCGHIADIGHRVSEWSTVSWCGCR